MFCIESSVSCMIKSVLCCKVKEREREREREREKINCVYIHCVDCALLQDSSKFWFNALCSVVS